MPKTPYFSIITITKNNVAGLEKTHKSIAKQSCKDFEWIVQDGTSTDKTHEYCTANKIPLNAEIDNGIYDAMNIAAKSDNYDFIYGDSIEDTEGTLTHKKSRPSGAISLGMFTHHQSMLYSRGAFADMQYDLKYTIASDYDLTARFLKKCSKTYYIPMPICVFESGGISQQKATLGRKEQFQIRKALNICPPWKNHLITRAQWLNWMLRRIAPNLYWSLKRG